MRQAALRALPRTRVLSAVLAAASVAALGGTGCRPDFSSRSPLEPPAPVIRLAFSADSIAIPVGGQIRVAVLALDEQGQILPEVTPRFESRDAAVFTVSATGVVRGAAPGTAMLIVRAGASRDSVRVRVSLPRWTVHFVRQQLTIGLADSASIEVYAGNDLGETAVPQLSSSNPAVAAISGNRWALARAGGTATVYAVAGNARDSIAVEVLPYGVHFCGFGQLDLNVGDVWPLCTYTNGALPSGALSVRSSDTTVVTVAAGAIRAAGAGDAYLVLALGRATDSMRVSIRRGIIRGVLVIPLGTGAALGLAVTDRLALVAHPAAGRLSPVALPSFAPGASLPGFGASDVALTRGGVAWIPRADSSDVVGYDLAAGAWTARIPLPAPAVRIALAPDEASLYAGAADGRIMRVNLARGTVTSAVVMPGEVTGLALASDGGTLYVADTRGSVAAVRTADLATLWWRAYGSRFGDVIVSADGTTLSIADAGQSTKNVAAATGQLLPPMPGLGGAYGLVASAGGEWVATTHPDCGCVTVVNPKSGTVQWIRTTTAPRRMAYAAALNALLVTTDGGDLLVLWL